MSRTLVFPVLLLALQVAAGVAYGLDGDWRRCVYWGAAAVLTAAVSF
jgi:uncharacterized membrane protein